MESKVQKSFVKQYATILKSVARILFGLVWLIDAFFKFQPDFAKSLPDLIQEGAASQPSWLNGWFSFWVTTTKMNTAFWAFLIAFTELGLAICLIFGFMRKIGYLVGILTSLVIWSVPEGFGGPYGPTSTDIGTGIIYALVFLFLIIINSLEGPSKYSIDFFIEQRIAWWRKVAEFS